jgi:hypothetical protein
MDGNSPSNMLYLRASRTGVVWPVETERATRWARGRSVTSRHRPSDWVWSSTAYTDSANCPLILLPARAPSADELAWYLERPEEGRVASNETDTAGESMLQGERKPWPHEKT